MKKLVGLCLVLIMSLFTLSLQVVGQDEMAVSDSSYDFIISDYFTNIKVLENGDLDVQEDIKVHFNQERHGIFRSIPFQYENLSGQLIAAPIEDVQVEGQQFETYTEGNNLILKIGSPDVMVIGDQEYRLHYTVKQGVRQYSAYQELYRNMMGPGWEVPIQSAQFLISFPQASWPWKNEDRFVYYGDYGSRSLVQNVILTDNILSGVLDASLQPRQAVTVGLKFPDKHFALLTAPDLDVITRYFKLIYLLPLLILAWCFSLRYRKGRDFPVATVTQYYPPDKMTPVEYLTYLKHSNSPQDIVSLIYLRASKGLIKIVETEGESIADSNNPISVVFNAAKNLLGQKENHIVLQKEKGATMEGMKEHEKILYRALFDGRDEVDITMEKDLYISLEDASDQVNSEFKYKKLYTPESTSAMRKMIFMLIGLIVFAIGYAVFVGGWYNGIVNLRYPGLFPARIIPFVISIFGSLFIMLIFFAIIKAKTRNYEELLSKLRGYKVFIEKVEKPQLQALLKQDPMFIDKTLPYAVVLGLAVGFLKVSEQALGQPYHPAWFIGHGIGFNTNSMYDAIQTISSSAWVTPPPSSGSWSSGGGFGGGGGFSGGGGGGGGGGSW